MTQIQEHTYPEDGHVNNATPCAHCGTVYVHRASKTCIPRTLSTADHPRAIPVSGATYDYDMTERLEQLRAEREAARNRSEGEER